MGGKMCCSKLLKVLKPILVGLLSALLAVVIGTFLGAIAGYFGGWIDDVLNWFYNIFHFDSLSVISARNRCGTPTKKGILSIVLI